MDLVTIAVHVAPHILDLRPVPRGCCERECHCNAERVASNVVLQPHAVVIGFLCIRED